LSARATSGRSTTTKGMILLGGTVEKTIASMKETLRFHLEGSREIPPGHSDAGDAVLVDVPLGAKSKRPRKT